MTMAETWRENKKEHTKRWKKEHPEMVKSARRKYYLANKEEEHKHTKEWAEENRESKREIGNKSIRKYRDNNPEYSKKQNARRKRNFGFNPLNEKFEGSVGHHINKNDVVYIPEELHRSIPHSQNNLESMEKINILATEYL